MTLPFSFYRRICAFHNCRLAVFAALMLGCWGCSSGNHLSRFQAPEQLILYSIDGRDVERRAPAQSNETFRGYPVLGKIEIADADMRKQLIDAFKDAYSRRPAQGGKCFWPRHGMRITERGATVEYVICFECLRFEEFIGETLIRHELLNTDVQPVFDRPLTNAGIPIAPRD